MAKSQKANVLVADAEPIARFGLVALINSHSRLRVCAEAETVAAAQEACAKWKPDIVVLDPELSGGDGFAFLKDLPRWCSHARAMIFTSREDAMSVQRALKNGAWAYMTRRDSVVEVMSALVGVLDHKRHVGPRVECVLLDELACGAMEMHGRNEAALSQRELQIFRLLGQARSARAIATELSVSVKTVETHQRRIKEKLGLANGSELRREAALFADDKRAAH